MPELEIVEPLLEKAVEQVASSQQQDVETNNLMPQDILKLPVQVLEGEEFEKWDYWFRKVNFRQLFRVSPTWCDDGQIDGARISYSAEYEGMLTQLQHALESALKIRSILNFR